MAGLSPWIMEVRAERVTALAKASGVMGFSPHAGRHDHFTRLLKAASSEGRPGPHGSSSVTVTLDVCSHVADGMQREAAERIDNDLRLASEGVGWQAGGEA